MNSIYNYENNKQQSTMRTPLIFIAVIGVSAVIVESLMYDSFHDNNKINKQFLSEISVSNITVTDHKKYTNEVMNKTIETTKEIKPFLRPTLTGLSQSTVPLLPTPNIKSEKSTTWTTTYDPSIMSAMCYIKVSNICVHEGEFIFYYPKEILKKYKPVFYRGNTKNTLVPAQTNKHKGNIGLCNEGIRKGSPDVQFRIEREREDPPKGWKVVGEDTQLNLLHCWEYVGYHLWYCLIGVFLRYNRHGGDVNSQKEIALTTVSGMGDTIRLGSQSNWNQTSRGKRPRDNSKYWPLWNSIIDSPSDIWVLYDRKDPICFKTAVLGSPNPYSVTVSEWRSFLTSFKKRMRLPERQLPKSESDYQIILIERKNSYRILNVDDVMKSLKEISSNTRLVVWEDMDVMQQLQTATLSDVIIGTHGSGLTWSALLPLGGSIIELWPGEAYNGNYITIANKTGLHHFELSHGKNQKRKTRFDYHVDITKLCDTIKQAIQLMQTKR